MALDHLVVELGDGQARVWLRSTLVYDGPRLMPAETIVDILREYQLPVEMRQITVEKTSGPSSPVPPETPKTKER